MAKKTYTIKEFREYLENKEQQTLKNQILAMVASISGGLLTVGALVDYAATTFNLIDDRNLSFKQYSIIIISALIMWAIANEVASKAIDSLHAIRRLLLGVSKGEMPEGIRTEEDVDAHVEYLVQNIRAERRERRLILANNVSYNDYYSNY